MRLRCFSSSVETLSSSLRALLRSPTEQTGVATSGGFCPNISEMHAGAVRSGACAQFGSIVQSGSSPSSLRKVCIYILCIPGSVAPTSKFLGSLERGCGSRRDQNNLEALRSGSSRAHHGRTSLIRTTGISPHCSPPHHTPEFCKLRNLGLDVCVCIISVNLLICSLFYCRGISPP